ATGLAGTVIGILKGAGIWQSLRTFAEIALQVTLQDLLEQMLIAQFQTKTPAVSTAVQEGALMAHARDIQITKDSIVLIGLIARHPSYNEFRPALLLDVQKFPTASDDPPIKGSLHLPKTDWGCPEKTFDTNRVFWDTEIRIKARPRDLVLPLTNIKWTIEIGNFTLRSIQT